MSTGGLGGAVLVALVAIVPLVVLMLTSFVKMSVVLALLRNAIGAPDAPSGLVVMGVSLILTFFVMAPVAIDMVRAAAAAAAPGGASAPDRTGGAPSPGPARDAGRGPRSPADDAEPHTGGAGPHTGGAGSNAGARPDGGGAGSNGGGAGSNGGGAGSGAPLVPLEIEPAVRQLVPAQYQPQLDAAERAIEPLRGFLARHAAARDRDTFAAIAQRMGRAASGDELWVLAPAFLATELREAFAIAVLIFLPFLVLDLVVALGLAALGLTTTQPQTVALPLKLLLFVAVDGWRLLLDALLRGYA